MKKIFKNYIVISEENEITYKYYIPNLYNNGMGTDMYDDIIVLEMLLEEYGKI